jgi:hypothetical protein
MNIEKALLDPSAVFGEPEAVISDATLSREQKIEILRRWEYDSRLLQVAEEEGMEGVSNDLLARIRDALHKLDFWPDTEQAGQSKTAGESKK